MQRYYFPGDFCEKFVNACRSEPCGPRRNCGLTYPGFECLECMPGYQLADNKCWGEFMILKKEETS